MNDLSFAVGITFADGAFKAGGEIVTYISLP